MAGCYLVPMKLSLLQDLSKITSPTGKKKIMKMSLSISEFSMPLLHHSAVGSHFSYLLLPVNLWNSFLLPYVALLVTAPSVV